MVTTSNTSLNLLYISHGATYSVAGASGYAKPPFIGRVVIKPNFFFLGFAKSFIILVKSYSKYVSLFCSKNGIIDISSVELVATKPK